MAEKRGKEPLSQVQWKEEKRVLTLEKIPVLELDLSFPQLTGGGRGGERSAATTSGWRGPGGAAGAGRPTGTPVWIWRACREVSRPFRPWAARLSGEVLFQDEGTLSIRMDAREVRGDGRSLQVRTGDLWKLPEGGPSAGAELFSGGPAVVAPPDPQAPGAGGGQAAAGDCFLDPDFGGRLRRWLSPYRCCRTPEGLEFYVPQCTLAPSAEGVVTFSLPLSPEPK